MFTVGGSYARLFSSAALISRVVLEVDAFFLGGKKYTIHILPYLKLIEEKNMLKYI